MSQFALYIMTLKGFESLHAIINNNQKDLLSYVVYGEDKNVQNDYSKEIIDLCKLHNIKFFNKNQIDYSLKFNYLITISWRWLIKNENEIPIIVLHDSLLPKYRGFAPLTCCLINGDNKLGVTAIVATEEYDKGPIISQEVIEIVYPIKIEEAIEKITSCYSKLIVNIFNTIKQGGKLTLTTQNESEATYSLWRDNEDYKIDWNNSAEKIKRFVDALGFPYSGASTTLNNQLIRVLDVTIIEDVLIEDRMIGKLIFYRNEKPVFVCGKGLLRIDKAIYEDSGESIFPLKKFRTRLS